VGNGFKVHNFFPGLLDVERMSLYVLLDYNAPTYFPPSELPQGVGVHPHRGIETVTFKGRVAHHDSAGHGGVIGQGDLQWMTAGGGVLHKEYHEEKFNREGGEFHMAQVWVNLPCKDKFTPAKYQAIVEGDIPRVALPGGAGEVKVVAGELAGTKSVASTFSPMEMYIVTLHKGGKVDIELPENYNTGILVAGGSVTVNGCDKAPTDHFVLFHNDGESIGLQADEDALLLLSGEPLGEPVAAGGPFVMNRPEELREAWEDFYAGKFGYLED
jgi:redox-sensitive bicupin YhaK (pirin superfamily)